MKCENCGKENPPGSTFCRECGKVIKNTPPKEKPKQENITPPEKNYKKIIILIIIIALIAIGGYLIYQQYNHNTYYANSFTINYPADGSYTQDSTQDAVYFYDANGNEIGYVFCIDSYYKVTTTEHAQDILDTGGTIVSAEDATVFGRQGTILHTKENGRKITYHSFTDTNDDLTVNVVSYDDVPGNNMLYESFVYTK